MHRLLFFLLLLSGIPARAQMASDSAAEAKQKAMMDSMINRYLAHAVYPLLKTSKLSGVIPVENPTDKLDPNLQYKLVFEVVGGTKDSTEAKDINAELAEAGRLINLHIAAGVPPKNLHSVVVVHGPALYALLKNEAYRKKFQMDNPNLEYIKELQRNGIRLVACGQAMFMLNIMPEDLLPEVKRAYSARTALTSYQMKGYILHKNLER